MNKIFKLIKMRLKEKMKPSNLIRSRMGEIRELFVISRVICIIFIFNALIDAAWCLQCPDTGWEKIGGMKPESISSSVALYSSVDSEGIVAACFNRCNSVNCTAFVIDIERNTCYSVSVDSDELVPEPNVTFYHKICITVPATCKAKRLWQVERTLGAVLLDSSAIWLPRAIARSECYESCIKAGTRCKSAQFRVTKPISTDDAAGRCALSTFERGTRPRAYRASMYRDEYLEDQCHNASVQDYCSYAEFQNASLPYSDVKIEGLDAKQCEHRCDLSEDGFICRSYTTFYSTGKSVCLLHSEDTISLGVSSLVPMFGATHKEKEPCLDLRVRCGESIMTIELTTTEPFEGRMYATGFADTCGIQGTGRNVTTLMLPLPKKEEVTGPNIKCGLAPAFSIDNENQTRVLVWVTVVVQFNPIIQRLGDQAVRVGCSLDDRDVPQPRNVSVHSSITFLDPHAGLPPIASTVVNVSSDVPTVTMKILDENQNDAIVTQLGQKLILKITIQPADGPYDIMAGHLVASSASGSSSYLLLNEVGCPTDPTTFPALLKDPTDNRSLLSTFTAFKFPDSQIVRFNVVVKFCLEECIPATCAGGQISYGRKRRSVNSNAEDPQNTVAEVTEIFWDKPPDELPLQLSIIVQSPVISADPLLSRENSTPDTVLIAGGSIDGLLCVDASLVLGLLIFWLIIQICLIIGCLLAIQRYRRMAIRAEEDRADILARHLYGIHGGNFEIARRVRWADHNMSSIS